MSESTVTMPNPELGWASILFETPEGEVESSEVDNESLVSRVRTR